MAKVNVKSIRGFNKLTVIECIIKNGPLTCEEIVKSTQLSRPTVVDILKEVQNNNIIKKMGRGEYSGGRLPVLYAIEPMWRFVLAVDFEYPRVKVAIVNFASEIVAEKTFHYATASNSVSPNGQERAGNMLKQLLATTDQLIAEFPHPKAHIIGICVTLSGMIDSQKGVSVKIERIADWVNVPIKRIFEERYNIETVIGNDVHIMAQYQRKLYSDLPATFIYIGIRYGIGMAVVRPARWARLPDGQASGENGFDSGTNGNAGFIGHTTIAMDGPKCICGKNGCLEAFASEWALLEKSQLFHNWNFTPPSVYDELLVLANENDQNAHNLLHDAFRALAIGVANAVKIIDVQTIVIDGFLQEKFQRYITIFEQTLHDHLYSELHNNLQIIWRSKDPDMTVKACGSYVFDSHIKFLANVD
ncbi:MAG: ROK family transcriptional regulator [Defluviitaleaceae bacterium]|nr:ROK family transcriptional regulator [Defluviitaleaceae bacterium]